MTTPVRSLTWVLFSILFLCFVASWASAADSLQNLNELGGKTSADSESFILAPIVSEGTPAEALKFDPVVPAASGRTKAATSVGDVSKELANDLPFHSNSNLRPGNDTGFSGVGKGEEETDVNLLGIPINRAQGGGADLGSFPQYLWSGYTYQIGPSLGAFDPRGVGGSLTLRLWTQENLGTEGSRVTGLYSSRDVQQYSVAKSSRNYALLAGISADSVFGPAFSLSTVPVRSGSTKVTTHLLFVDTFAKNFGSSRSGSAAGEQRTDRAIPVVQIDKTFSAKTQLKSSFFYDQAYVKYEDFSDASMLQRKTTRQIGNESALVSGDTRIGFGVRNVSYKRNSPRSSDDFPSESIANAQLTQGLRYKSLLIEPTLGGYGVTRQGFFPTASLGVRNELKSSGSKFGQFARAGFTRRFPSLLDRYYEIAQTVSTPHGTMTVLGISNPDLTPENVRSVESGVDFKQGFYKTQLIGFVRDYKHARYTRFSRPAPTVTAFQVVNAGNAHVYGFTHSQDFRLSPFLDFGTRVGHQSSRIDDLGDAFPYTPEWVGIVKIDLHDESNRHGLSLVQKGATDFVSYNESNRLIPMAGYGYLDAFVRTEITRDLTAVIGVENVFDKPIQYRSGAVPEGREFFLSANSVF